MVLVDHQPSQNCKRASQRALMKSTGGCAQTVYSWTRRSWSRSGWLQFVDSTNCRFESALTSWFRLPSFEISEFLLILTSRCGLTSHDRRRPVFRSCVSSVQFAVQCPDPWSSCWLHLLFLVVWTTEMWHLQASPQHLLRRLQSVMNAAARLVYSSSRWGHITPLLRQLHWLKTKEWLDFKLAVLVYKCMHGTAPPYRITVISVLKLIYNSSSIYFCVNNCVSTSSCSSQNNLYSISISVFK